MSTTVSIKLSPEQFDHLRKVLRTYSRDQRAITQDKSNNAKIRSEARTEAAKTGLLLDYLNRV